MKSSVGIVIALIALAAAYFARWGPLLQQPLSIAILGCHILHTMCAFQPVVSFDMSMICDAPMCAQVTDAGDLDARIMKALENAKMFSPPVHEVPRRNFALLSGGAKVLAGLTSPTKGLPGHGLISKMLVWARGQDVANLNVNLPSIVIEGGSKVSGECWEFSGNKGHIAIHLQGLVVVSDVTIYHVPSGLVSYADAMKMPRRMVLWGLPTGDGPDFPDGAINNRQFVSPEYFTSAQNKSPPHPVLPTDRFLALSTFEYDVAAGGYQSFPVSEAAHYGYLGFTVLIFEVLSNSGSNSTCLYHIEVHGTEI